MLRSACTVIAALVGGGPAVVGATLSGEPTLDVVVATVEFAMAIADIGDAGLSAAEVKGVTRRPNRRR